MKIKFNFVNMLKYNCYILIKINDILYWNIISIKNFQLLYLHLPTKMGEERVNFRYFPL